MIEVVLPVLPERELVLESVSAVRASVDDVRSPVPGLAGRVALGGPCAVPVTAEYVAEDPALRAFVEQESATSLYHVVHLSVSFAPRPTAPRLGRVSVELRLASTSTAVEPVAWSMTPLRVSSTVHVQDSVRLGPQLKLEHAQVSLGEIGRSVSRDRGEVFLQALRELRSDPAWEFTRTRAISLSGSHRLVLVVRASRDGETSISGAVRAVTRGNLLRRYERELPDPLALASVL
jgi:hypothetical protein